MLLSTGEQVSTRCCDGDSRAPDAVSFTGPQVGIVTDSVHSKAKITEVRADRVKEALADGKIVIIAGFQGITPDGQITTLGRGGSDTTAVAVAAGVGADVCEIYTDVDGVYTADPRIVPDARKIDEISEAMLEMAASGAGVLQMRSVSRTTTELSSTLIILQRPSWNNRREADDMEQAIALVSPDTGSETDARDVPDHPGVAASVFGKLADNNVNVDMIIQNVSEDGTTDISFTAPKVDLARAKRALDEVVDELGAREWSVDESIAKVSLVGAGMRTHPGIAAGMFKTLADAGEPGHDFDLADPHLVRHLRRSGGPRSALHAFGLEDAGS
jgi:aspartate kinase